MKNGALFDELPDWIPRESWAGWLEMRRQKRIPTTDGARKLALKTLARLREEGEVVEYVLGQSEFKGWSGLFPVGEEYYQMLGIDRTKQKESAVIVKFTDRSWAR